MMHTARGLAALAALFVTQTLGAQQVERLTSPPVTTFPEPFSAVSGLRELSDGRVLISDRLEQIVRLVDLRAGTWQEVGRAGSGPGEYQLPTGLLPLAGDTTVLVDLGNLRLSIVSPGGRIVRSTSMMRGNDLARPTAVDRTGLFYFDDGGVRMNRDGAIDTDPHAAIVRFRLGSDRTDTVAFLPLPASSGETRRATTGSGGRGGFSIVGGLAPYAARAEWAASPDGRIAIVHADPYRVEWVAPDGATVTGGPVEYDPVRITNADKEAWADRMSQAFGIMVGGGNTMRIPRPDVDQQEWPEFKPPFGRGAAMVAPDGMLWVRRLGPHGAAQVFDVFDGRGDRVKQVELPRRRQLVGFGTDRIYLVNVDDDDLQWLEVYRY